MIIGITGFYCSGKDTVAEYLLKKGFTHFSLSDVIRDELRKEGKEITRDALVAKGNHLRQNFGPGVLAERVSAKMDACKNYVVTSIRNPAEVAVLAKRKDFALAFIDAPIKERLKRIISRKRESDPKTLEELKKYESLEENKDPTGQQLSACKNMAGIILINSGDLKQLYAKVDKMVAKLEKKMKSSRPNWDEYFMDITRTVSERATCDRGKCGAIIVKDKRILCTGYVGAPAGLPHCDEAGHLFQQVYDKDGNVSNHCIRTTHAEQNAIVQAARYGTPIDGSTLYCKMEPCIVCAKMIINAGIKRVVCEKKYHSAQLTRKFFREAGVKLEVLKDETVKYENM
jgi:dCMP deaminase